jgi:hypothetical protein
MTRAELIAAMDAAGVDDNDQIYVVDNKRDIGKMDEACPVAELAVAEDGAYLCLSAFY